MAADLDADLAEHAPCGLLATSPRGQIVAANQTLLTWLGVERAALVGRRRFQELLTVPGRIYYETHFAPLLRLQGFVHEVAVDLVVADGAVWPVLVSASERRDPAGHPQGIRIAIARAADRRTYERELLLARRMAEQALKAKADFLGVFAHEIRNALSAMQIGAELLRGGELPDSARGSLASIERGLERADGLLHSMLEVSRFEAGRVDLDRRRFELREVVTGVTATLVPAARRKGLALDVGIDPAVPRYLVGDAMKIGQVIANLVGNAVKFTEAGAVTVEVDGVSLSPVQAVLRFAVRDTGIGIPADRLSTIFDEYVQASPDIAARFGGSGLGLAICRRIVELHGSRIEVDSAPGAGSTFSFVLALAVAEAPP
jgi:PAS domain S-box-containing protein